jgi:diaminopimelate epimerase
MDSNQSGIFRLYDSIRITNVHRTIPFTKLSATCNDFILIDNREKIFKGDEVELFHRLCQRRTGIGADGILLIEKNPTRDFTMRYFNADGCESEMCGNGARATAYYAFQRKLAQDTMDFDVSQELYHAVVSGNTVRLRMRKPFDLNLTPKVLDEPVRHAHDKPRMIEGGFVNTGVPHYVIFVDEVDELNVVELGRKYRHHNFFAPAGTNVNFVKIAGASHLQMRTYERGVEDETLACGTGTIAAAVLAHLQKKMPFPIAVTTRGGELTVYGDASLENLKLEGEVQEIFTGQFTLDK